MVARQYVAIMRRLSEVMTAYDADVGEIIAWSNSFNVGPKGQWRGGTYLTMGFADRGGGRYASAGDPDMQDPALVPPRWFARSVSSRSDWTYFAGDKLVRYCDHWTGRQFTNDGRNYVYVEVPEYDTMEGTDAKAMYLLERMLSNHLQSNNQPEL